MKKHKKKWLAAVIVLIVIVVGYLTLISGSRFYDLRRFVDPIYAGNKNHEVRNREGEDVTEKYVEDTKKYYTFRFYWGIEDYIKDNELSLSRH